MAAMDDKLTRLHPSMQNEKPERPHGVDWCSLLCVGKKQPLMERRTEKRDVIVVTVSHMRTSRQIEYHFPSSPAAAILLPLSHKLRRASIFTALCIE